MDFVADERSETGIDELVPRQRTLAFEFGGDNECFEVMIVVARDLNDRVLETGRDEFLNFCGLHVLPGVSLDCGAQCNRIPAAIPMRGADCV